MKVLVCIIVYDRIENIKKWLHCWSMCNTSNAELVVIHNHNESNEIEKECLSAGVKYIARINKGFDIGAFKDVCTGVVPVPEFDYLLWVTDDVLPTKKDFIKQFISKMDVKTSVSCMEVSAEVRPHIRTTGFCMSKENIASLQFANTIETKEHCYQFEHRGKNTLYDQCVAMGNIVQISNIETSPLWDTGQNSRKAKTRYDRRSKEFQTEFAKRPTGKVVFICPIFNSFPEIVSSMINQTYKNWELILVHDGPNNTGLKKLIANIGDNRITYIETKERVSNWGHSLRSEYIQSLSSDAAYVVVTNADNHHVPTYIEYMLKGFTNGQVATYCSHMVHSYKAHQVIPCRLERGYVDCAGVMVRADIARKIGWNNVTDHSADWLYFYDIAKAYGWERFAKVEGCLLIHN